MHGQDDVTWLKPEDTSGAVVYVVVAYRDRLVGESLENCPEGIRPVVKRAEVGGLGGSLDLDCIGKHHGGVDLAQRLDVIERNYQLHFAADEVRIVA